MPAETCKESKQAKAESKEHWLSTIKPGSTVLAYCDMKTKSKIIENMYIPNSIKVSLAVKASWALGIQNNTMINFAWVTTKQYRLPVPKVTFIESAIII